MDGKNYGLNANELCVYEAIAKCSRGENAKGWYASMQSLADSMPFKIDDMTVRRAVEKLIKLGLSERKDNALFIIAQNENTPSQIEKPMSQNENQNSQNEQNSTPLNNPPIKNINNNDKNEQKETRTPSRDEEKGLFIMDVNFNNFWTAFHPSKEMNSRKAQCRWLWEEILTCSVRQQIFNELLDLEADDQLTSERNPFFYLRNFAPREPHNCNGDYSIDKDTCARLISAKYNGKYGAYTPEHILLFHLEVAPDSKPQWDAYLRYVMSVKDKKPPKY